jgi:sterol desaturase/sphingolipid hydroxylase (fatty acid hydroxylase superfamily)
MPDIYYLLPKVIQENILVLITTPIYVVIILAEIIASKISNQNNYGVKDTFINIYFTVCNMIIDLLTRGFALFVYAFFYQFKIITISNQVFYWLTLIICQDFCYYWLHFMDHYVRLFWAMHVTHHSSQYLNFTVGFRSTVFEPVFRFFYFFPLALFGFKGVDIIFIYAATQIWGILVHTNLIKSLGPLEWVFTTPSHHRVHHASNVKYLDKNMGMLLIIWDRLFGTFQKELPASEYEPIKYGLTTNIETNHPGKLIFHEWQAIITDTKKAKSWKDKLGYIFYAPGWSHNQTTFTSKQLRNKLNEK